MLGSTRVVGSDPEKRLDALQTCKFGVWRLRAAVGSLLASKNGCVYRTPPPTPPAANERAALIAWNRARRAGHRVDLRSGDSRERFASFYKMTRNDISASKSRFNSLWAPFSFHWDFSCVQSRFYAHFAVMLLIFDLWNQEINF